MTNQVIASDEREALISLLRLRFERNMQRHAGIDWAELESVLTGHPRALWSLSEMERSGGGPDVIGRETTGVYLFVDCSAESPDGRRSYCYDRKGQGKREKEGLQVAGNVLDSAAAMGIELLTEERYCALQTLGDFDTKTQSWLETPPEIAKLGGAIFGDRRFGRVFVYHNTPESFYRGRGFRGMLRVSS